jgi:hypothetical protein
MVEICQRMGCCESGSYGCSETLDGVVEKVKRPIDSTGNASDPRWEEYGERESRWDSTVNDVLELRWQMGYVFDGHWMQIDRVVWPALVPQSEIFQEFTWRFEWSTVARASPMNSPVEMVRYWLVIENPRSWDTIASRLYV